MALPHLANTDTQAMMHITQSSINLMGASFILGSLFTILLLMVIDYMRSRRVPRLS